MLALNINLMQIALELCAGGSVADLIRLSDGPMTESEIGWIIRDAGASPCDHCTTFALPDTADVAAWRPPVFVNR